MLDFVQPMRVGINTQVSENPGAFNTGLPSIMLYFTPTLIYSLYEWFGE